MGKTLVIHKHCVLIADQSTVEIQGLAGILSFAVQRDDLVMYYGVDLASMDILVADIRIFGTGQETDADILKDYEFRGTHVLSNGDLMWHVWARIYNKPTTALNEE